MRPFMFTAVAVLALVTCVGAQRNRTSSASTAAGSRDEILELEKERNQAIISGDAGALERMTSDDYTFITLRGELRTKAEIVEGFNFICAPRSAGLDCLHLPRTVATRIACRLHTYRHNAV